MLTRFFIASALVLICGYGLMEAYPLLAGPSLSIDSPSEYAVLTDPVITVSGTAIRTSSLTLNGAPLLPQADGSFVTTFAFPKGTTILTFVAKDRFGRSRTATKTISVL